MHFSIIRFSATDFYKEHGKWKKSQPIFIIDDRHWFKIT